MLKKPYAFSFWDSSSPTPAYIDLCAQTRARNLPAGFEPVQLDFKSCLEWVPERDAIWKMSEPVTEGRSHSGEGRRWAIFCGMLRIALLQKYGGIWIDADTIIFEQFALLAPIVTSHDLVAPEYDGQRIANSVIGGKAGSKFFKLHWQHILKQHKKKQASGDLRASWGEYGHRMIRRIFFGHPNLETFILPFGMLIPFDSEEQSPVFNPVLKLQDYLPITAVGLSFYNNTVSGDLRSRPAKDLLADDTIFSQATRLALGQTKNHLALSGSEQLVPYNRSAHLRAGLIEVERLLSNQKGMKKKLQSRTDKLKVLKAQNRQNK
jgi:capsular polysaccharide synthesis protein